MTVTGIKAPAARRRAQQAPGRYARRQLGEAGSVTVDYDVAVPLAELQDAETATALATALTAAVTTAVESGAATIGETVYAVEAVAAARAPKIWKNSKFTAGLAGKPAPKLYTRGREEFEGSLVCTKSGGLSNNGKRYTCGKG